MLSNEGPSTVYLIQAVTFSGGRISRVWRESVARSEYGAQMAAAAFKQDIELLEASCSIYINDALDWTGYMAPDAPKYLHNMRKLIERATRRYSAR